MTTINLAAASPASTGGTHSSTVQPAHPVTAPAHTAAASSASTGLFLSIGALALVIGIALKVMGRTTWVAAFVWVVVGASCGTIASTALGLFTSGATAVDGAINK